MKYSIYFWGISSSAISVFIAQKCILRSIHGLDNRFFCIPIFRNFAILTLPFLVIFEICLNIINNNKKIVPLFMIRILGKINNLMLHSEGTKLVVMKRLKIFYKIIP